MEGKVALLLHLTAYLKSVGHWMTQQRHITCEHGGRNKSSW